MLLAMVPGLSVKEAAEVLGIGENTAKTHLQHIHSKTGTSKQTELMRLFMSSTPPVKADLTASRLALAKNSGYPSAYLERSVLRNDLHMRVAERRVFAMGH